MRSVKDCPTLARTVLFDAKIVIASCFESFLAPKESRFSLSEAF